MDSEGDGDLDPDDVDGGGDGGDGGDVDHGGDGQRTESQSERVSRRVSGHRTRSQTVGGQRGRSSLSRASLKEQSKSKEKRSPHRKRSRQRASGRSSRSNSMSNDIPSDDEMETDSTPNPPSSKYVESLTARDSNRQSGVSRIARHSRSSSRQMEREKLKRIQSKRNEYDTAVLQERESYRLKLQRIAAQKEKKKAERKRRRGEVPLEILNELGFSAVTVREKMVELGSVS